MLNRPSAALIASICLLASVYQPLFADDAKPTPGEIRAGAQQDGTSPVSRCAELCGRLYGSEPPNRALCEEGCAEAERCTSRCREEFADDGDKLARCNYRCARAR